MTSEKTEENLLYTLRKEKGTNLKIDIWYEGEIWVFRPFGSVDTGTAADLGETLTEGISQGMHWIVIDLTDVRYISSAGLRVLIAAAKEQTHRKGEIRLSSPNEAVDQVLRMSGLQGVFRIFPDNESAVSSFQSTIPK